MNEQRFVVSDVLWQRLKSHLPGKVSEPEQRQKTIVCFWKRSCGGCAPARRGAICHLPLAIGTASSGGFAGGPSPVYSRVFSKR